MPDPLTTKIPFPGSYWVIPGKLLAGEYPATRYQNETNRKLYDLLSVGVSSIVDLTSKNDAVPYHPQLVELMEQLNIKVVYRQFSILDVDIPTVEFMKSILDWIDAELARGHMTYVHCVGGIGRTGTVVGCFLARHGMSGPQALERLSYLRKETPKGWYTSPETWLQKDFVENWKPGE
jgi:protein-tyrosine phosphatase